MILILRIFFEVFELMVGLVILKELIYIIQLEFLLKIISSLLLRYCVRPLEFSAAVGLVQLEKWPELHKARLKNAKVFTDLFKDRETVLIPMYEENSTWFGFPMLVDSGKTRRRLIQSCEWKGIDTRPIVAGNFLNQPVIRYFEQIYETGSYRNAERIDKCGLFFGNDNRDLEPQLMQLRLFV